MTYPRAPQNNAARRPSHSSPESTAHLIPRTIRPSLVIAAPPSDLRDLADGTQWQDLGTAPPSPELDGFADMDLAPSVLDAIYQLGYRVPTDVQSQVIPLMIEGRDVVGQSQTGTGKTAAFGAPIASMVDPDVRQVQAIILVPTRELCIQVADALDVLARPRGLRVLPVYGGKSLALQADALAAGVQIVVGTPGRVLDHIGRGTLRLDLVSVAVLDECDEMLDIGFAEDIDRILSYTPTPRQTALFSATLPAFVLELVDRYLVQPEFVSVRPDMATVAEIQQEYCELLEQDKVRAIRRVLRRETDDSRLLVFRRTQRGVDWLVRRLEGIGVTAEGIHGALTQDRRERVLQAFRRGEIRVLVATNVAARGLDIKDVSHVVNYDIPQSPEEYVHRIGRTGRAGNRGKAITFVGEWDFDMLDAIRARVGTSLQSLDLGLN